MIRSDRSTMVMICPHMNAARLSPDTAMAFRCWPRAQNCARDCPRNNRRGTMGVEDEENDGDPS